MARVQTFGRSVLGLWLGSVAFTASAGPLDTKMQAILVDYLKIQNALAADVTTGLPQAAGDLAAKAKQITPAELRGEHAEHFKDLPAKLATGAGRVAGAASIAAAREAFKELSRPMAMWASMTKPKGVDVVFCSMAGASWLQKRGDIRNPYYGKEMLACGEIVGGDKAGAEEHAH